MKRVENIEDRADHVLQQIVKSGQRRDRLLDEVAALVRDHRALQDSLGRINEVRYQQLPQYVERSAALAKTMEGSASLAERSSRRVKKLDALCSRVQRAKLMAESMISMKETVAHVPAVLASRNLEKTVELITSYEAARKQLAARGASSGDESQEPDGDENAGGAASPTSPSRTFSSSSVADPLIVQARREVSEKLTEGAKAAMTVNDKLTIMKSVKLLARLGLHKDGMKLYCNWMCDHTIAALKKIVERELRKMESPTEVAMSHLALVSQALDTVAAAYEAEEEFTLETFGHEGPLLLLTLLHQRSTAECVPVLRNFISKRKDALASLDRASRKAAEDARRRRRRHGGGGEDVDDDDDDDDEDEDVDDWALGVATREGEGAADARRADQTLEETSHLVSCCHIYLDFAEAKRAEHVAALKKAHAARVTSSASPPTSPSAAAGAGGGGGPEAGRHAEEPSSIVSAADRLWSDGSSSGGSNALLGVVQEILAMYVPLQSSYFEAAFRQALQLQLQAIHGSGGGGGMMAGGGSARRSPQPQSSPKRSATATVSGFPIDSPASFMAGITNIYAAALGGGGVDGERQAAVAAAMDRENSYYLQGGAITLPDDVFFFLRIAVHRALNTKSTQIASAVVTAATDVIQHRLIPEIAKRAAPPPPQQQQQTSLPPTPRALRWACAAQRVTDYCRKLAQELRVATGAHHVTTRSGGASAGPPASSPSASSSFSNRDMVRFRELAQDLDILAKDLKATEATWMTQDAHMCVAYVLSSSAHLERFSALSYNITEEAFYHFELNDPWMQAFLVGWAALLDYVAAHLAEQHLFDLFLTDVARALARRVREGFLKKSFSTFGALQADKDVRALREFFFQRAHEVSSLREVFAPLSLTSTLLLSDAPRDALEESHNTALTAEEKRAVLLLRVDFKRQEVLALKL